MRVRLRADHAYSSLGHAITATRFERLPTVTTVRAVRRCLAWLAIVLLASGLGLPQTRVK